MEAKLDNLHSYITRPIICQLYRIGGIISNVMAQNGKWYLYNRRMRDAHQLVYYLHQYNEPLFSSIINNAYRTINTDKLPFYILDNKIRSTLKIDKYQYITCYIRKHKCYNYMKMVYYKAYIKYKNFYIPSIGYSINIQHSLNSIKNTKMNLQLSSII
jgi:hypothetical protein